MHSSLGSASRRTALVNGARAGGMRRLAVKEAKSQSAPKDVIDRAAKKSTAGKGDDYEEIRYEGYGPNGVAVIVEAKTDNRNRTASTVRSTFTKNGGNLGETSSVDFMFDRKGEVTSNFEASDEVMEQL